MFYICYICYCVVGSENYVHRDTKQGSLKGITKAARNGNEYHAFLGIPYAQPPVNELRWETPRPALTWEGVKDATTNPSVCMQEFVLNPEEVVGMMDNSDIIITLII